MKDYEILIPPKLSIKEVAPLLADETRIYASALKAQLTKEISLNIIERQGRNLSDWTGREAECLLEIIDAEFSFPPKTDNKEELPSNLLELKYLGYRDSCHFFPIPEKARQTNGKIDRQIYQTAIDSQFAEYGENGFGLEPFDNQPIFKSSNGYAFLINKYLYKHILKKIRKGTWLLAKINEVELFSIAEVSKREQGLIPANRITEEEQQAEAMKIPRRKRFGVF